MSEPRKKAIKLPVSVEPYDYIEGAGFNGWSRCNDAEGKVLFCADGTIPQQIADALNGYAAAESRLAVAEKQADDCRIALQWILNIARDPIAITDVVDKIGGIARDALLNTGGEWKKPKIQDTAKEGE